MGSEIVKTLKGWTTQKLTYDDPRCEKYYHCPHILIYNDHEVILSSGETDSIYLFSHNNEIILLSINERHSYAGITVYNRNMEELTEQFLQADYDFMSIMEIDDLDRAVDKFFSYSPNYQAKLLLAIAY